MKKQGWGKIILAGFLSLSMAAESFSLPAITVFASEAETVSSDSVSGETVRTVSEGSAIISEDAVTDANISVDLYEETTGEPVTDINAFEEDPAAEAEPEKSEDETEEKVLEKGVTGEPPLNEGEDPSGFISDDGVSDEGDLGVTYHTQTEISSYLKAHPVNAKAPSYDEKPDITNAPYSAGKLDTATNEAAIQMLNNIRYVAGLNADVTINEDYGKKTQAASLVNFLNDKLSHNPEKPAGIDDDLYKLGSEGAGQSNIYCYFSSGSLGTSIPDSILHGYMADEDESNIDRVGHRRWVLNPTMQQTGFGAVTGKCKSGWNAMYSAMYAFDMKGSGKQTKVSWPAQQMPVSWFHNDYPWSLSLGTTVDEDKVKVELTRTSDNKKWTFSKSAHDGDFYVNNVNYGQPGCIIFRPNSVSYKAGDEFQVTVTGAAGSDISYKVTFFNPDKPSDDPEPGKGSIDAPWNIKLNETVTKDGLTGTENTHYYSFDVTQKGYIQPFLRKEGKDDMGYINIDIFSESVKDSNLVYKWVQYGRYKTNPVEFSDIGTTGLRPGHYVMRLYVKSCSGYAAKISFKQSEQYEEEPDSTSAPKAIKTGTYYYGEVSNENQDRDYYYFKLSKKSKVTLEVTMDDYNGSVALFKDDAYSEEIIGASKMFPSKQCELAAGTYYVKADSGFGGKQTHMAYKFKITVGSSSSGGKTDPETGTAKLNGEEVHSLKEAFKKIKTNEDFELELLSDMDGEKNLTIPNKATSVTIKGNGKTIKIVGTSFTSNTNLKLENVKIIAVKTNGNPSTFTLNAKKGLMLGENVSFEAAKVTVKAVKEMEISDNLNADIVTAGTLSLKDKASLNVNKNARVTVSTAFNSEKGAKIVLGEGFNRPITINGTATGNVSFTGEKIADGTQVLSARPKKLTEDDLRSVFDVSGITDNKISTYLYYYSGGRAGIFGEAISYGDKNYGLWKTALAQMNADVKNGASEIVIKLNGDVNTKGAFNLPRRGYQNLTVNGGGHTVTFTGNVRLTGNTVFSELTLNKINGKGQNVFGKVIKGKYDYSGPETF